MDSKAMSFPWKEEFAALCDTICFSPNYSRSKHCKVFPQVTFNQNNLSEPDGDTGIFQD